MPVLSNLIHSSLVRHVSLAHIHNLNFTNFERKRFFDSATIFCVYFSVNVFWSYCESLFKNSIPVIVCYTSFPILKINWKMWRKIFFKCQHLCGWGDSPGEAAYCQAWWPEFCSWDAHGERKNCQSCQFSSDLHMYSVACVCTHTLHSDEWKGRDGRIFFKYAIFPYINC